MKKDEVVTLKKKHVNILVVIFVTFVLGYSIGAVTTDTTAVPVNTQTPVLVADASLEDDDPMRGVADAPVTIVEFGDYQCPFCKRLYDNFKGNIEPYIDRGEVKHIYRDFPLKSIHPQAFQAAEASQCADAQGKFWQYHDLLYDKQTEWSGNINFESLLSDYAQEVGLDIQKFESCLENGEMALEVEADYQAALALGVGSTPTFYINGRQIVGAVPWEQVKQAIESLL